MQELDDGRRGGGLLFFPFLSFSSGRLVFLGLHQDQKVELRNGYLSIKSRVMGYRKESATGLWT